MMCRAALLVVLLLHTIAGQLPTDVYFTRLFATITQREGIHGNGKTPLNFDATVETDSRSIGVLGSKLWQLSMFGSSMADGSGQEVSLSEQLLNADNSGQTLNDGGTLHFVFSEDINLQEVGPFTAFPYLCLRFQQAESPSVSFTSNLITACSSITLIERTSVAGWREETQRAISAVASGTVEGDGETLEAQEFVLGGEDEIDVQGMLPDCRSIVCNIPRCPFGSEVDYVLSPGQCCYSCKECTVVCDECPEGWRSLEIEGECCPSCGDPCADIGCTALICPAGLNANLDMPPGQCCPTECTAQYQLRYIFSFLENYNRGAVGHVWVQPTERDQESVTNGHARQPSRNTKRTFKFKGRLRSDVYSFSLSNPSGTGMQDTTIFVESDKYVQVLGIQRTKVADAMDTFNPLTVDKLGYDYVVASYSLSETHQDAYPNFVFTATQDATQVVIRFVQDFEYEGSTYNKENPLTLTLNKFESFQCVTTFDATGTRVTANQPISVLSGSMCSSIPVNSPDCDHLIEFLPPVSSWGRHATVAPFQSRTSGYVVRVIAAYPNTKVIFSDDVENTFVIHPGEFIERDSDIVLSLSASEPVLVAQYSKSDSTDGNGKAAMVIVPSTERSYRGTQILQVPTVGKGFSHYLTIFLQSDNVNEFRMNQRRVDWEELGEDFFGTHVLRTSIRPGQHIFRHRQEDTYRGYIYGTKPGSSSYIHPIQHDLTPFVSGPVCRVWGDPHYLTFDGHMYDFQGSSRYVIAKDCHNEDGFVESFQIIADNYQKHPGDPYTFIEKITLEYDDHRYTLLHPEGVEVDGVEVVLPYYDDDHGISISFSTPHRVLRTAFGLFMRLDDKHNSDYNIPPTYRERSCGLCGFYDGDKENDQRNPEDILTLNPDLFGYSWKVPGIPATTPVPELRLCPMESEMRILATSECGILTDNSGLFASCNAVVDPTPFFDSCVYDLCQTQPDTTLRCDSFEQYAYACYAAGGSVPDWRSTIRDCRKMCPTGMTYNRCGRSCPASCFNLEGDENCPYKCLETCDCPAGQALEGTQCVDVGDCGCVTEDNTYISKGDSTVNSDCSEVCTCNGGGDLTCEALTCAENAVCDVQSGVRNCYCAENFQGDGRVQCDAAMRMCQIFGDPHYITYDGKKYTYQGECRYTLTKRCKRLRNFPEFQVIGTNVRRHAYEAFTFQRGIELLVGGRSYKIAFHGDVTVDGTSVTDLLPHKAGPVKILYEYGNVVLETTFGVRVMYDGQNDAQIEIPSAYFGKMCGLCGNADSDDSNELQMPSGDMASNVIEFADSWQYEDCGDTLPEPEPCVPGSQEYKNALSACSQITDTVDGLSYCHAFADPTPFFETCMYDSCLNPGSKMSLCDSAKAYISRCQLNGGDIGDRFDDLYAYCAYEECPYKFVKYEGSCYRFYTKNKSYYKAARYCDYRGGNLATIQSAAENDFVANLTRGLDAWIGGVRDKKLDFEEYRTKEDHEIQYEPIETFVVSGTRQLDFQVKAGRDAKLFFSADPSDEDQYVLVIGAEYNMKTQIKRCLSCETLVEFESSELNVVGFKRFHVRFDNGVVSVGRPGENRPFLSWVDSNPIEVNYIGYANEGPRAVWQFFKREFKWSNGDAWEYQNYHVNEPNDEQAREDCLQINFEDLGLWNDHFCERRRGYVCESRPNFA